MHFSILMQSMEGRHLIYAYAAVFALQGGYCLWTVRNWFKLPGTPPQTR